MARLISIMNFLPRYPERFTARFQALAKRLASAPLTIRLSGLSGVMSITGKPEDELRVGFLWRIIGG